MVSTLSVGMIGTLTPVLDHFFVLVKPGFPEHTDPIFNLFQCQVTRQHPGQGTENVCALFEDNYMEFMWVSNANDAAANPLHLDERANWRKNQSSPFGIALRTPLNGDIFHYKPKYIPPDKTIDFLQASLELAQPLTFSLSFARRSADRPDCKQVNFLHRAGHLKIIGINITFPNSTESASETIIKAVTPIIVFTKGTSWFAQLLLQTDDSSFHGKQLTSDSLPLSLHIFCNEPFSGMPTTFMRFFV